MKVFKALKLVLTTFFLFLTSAAVNCQAHGDFSGEETKTSDNKGLSMDNKGSDALHAQHRSGFKVESTRKRKKL